MSTPTPCKINVFIDSDGPVANFDMALVATGRPAEVFKLEPGVYLWLNVTPGASETLEELKMLDDLDVLRVWILTKTPSNSPYAYTEKVLWYRRHFPWLEDRVILTHDKHLLGGAEDFLLDDRPHKANVQHFRGTFMFFDVLRPLASWTAFTRLIRTAVEPELTHLTGGTI